MVSLELEARLDNLLVTAQEETAHIDLFTPIPEREECPICMIPLPIGEEGTIFMKCCGKTICRGCGYKAVETDEKNGVDPFMMGMCAFCRQPPIHPKNQIKALKKLMKKNNPKAFVIMATRYEEGNSVIQSDTKSLEMRIRAAELGSAQAIGLIGKFYEVGRVVEQNMSKVFEFLEVSAKKRSVLAHHLLALYEEDINIQKSIKHYKVAACAGYRPAMDGLMNLYRYKLLSKEDLAQTLRAFQVSNDLTKSKERDYARALNRQVEMATKGGR